MQCRRRGSQLSTPPTVCYSDVIPWTVDCDSIMSPHRESSSRYEGLAAANLLPDLPDADRHLSRANLGSELRRPYSVTEEALTESRLPYHR